MFDHTDVWIDGLVDSPQSSRPVDEDDDSDDSSTQHRPQRRVPAFNSSSQENSSLVVKGIKLKMPVCQKLMSLNVI